MTGRLYAPGAGLPPVQAHLERFAPSTALSHNRVRPLQQAVRDTERNTEGIGAALSAGVTGENSPLYTYQPTKKKTDRVLMKYFCR